MLVTYYERTGAYVTVYRVVSSRLMARSAAPGRYSLRCQVMGRSEDLRGTSAGAGARSFTIVWSRRDGRRPR